MVGKAPAWPGRMANGAAAIRARHRIGPQPTLDIIGYDGGQGFRADMFFHRFRHLVRGLMGASDGKNIRYVATV